MERAHPVESTTLSCSRAVSVHPVHTILCEQRHQWLSQFFYRFVECFRRAVSVFTQNFVLCQQQTLDCTHQWTTFSCQVGSSFTAESCFKQITWTDTDTQCNCSVHCIACCILIDSVRRVQTATFEEHGTQRSTRTFRSHHNHVDIFWRNYTCAITPCDSEAMREIKSFSGSQVRFDSWPYRHYCRIRQQTHNDCTFLTSLFNAE